MKLRALIDHIYANKRVRKGEDYEASAKDAKVLILMNRSVMVEDEVEAEEAEAPRKRRYRRKDMTAESG